MKMFWRIVIVIFVAAVFIGIEGKPIRKDIKALKNVGRSILRLKLTQDNLNHDVSIKIKGKPHNRQEIGLLHFMPSLKQLRKRELKARKGRRENYVQARKRPILLKKLIKSLATKKTNDPSLNAISKNKHENSIVVPMRNVKRSKRNAAMKKMQRDSIDDLNKFNEDADNNDDTDYSEEKPLMRSHHGQQQRAHEQEQKQQLKFIKSEDYQDYAFDTTDTEQFNEDDDLLRRYYGHSARRSAVDDYDSFTDFMRLVANRNSREDRFVKQLHYGNEKFLNDDGIDEENDDDMVSDEYDSYDDY